MNKNSAKPEMVFYTGHKAILASGLITRKEYCNYRGWDLPEDEDGSELVRLVEYTDGGHSNDIRHLGYISMSPASVFEGAYKKSGEMSYGDAVFLLKRGYRVCRLGWNGKKMFLVYVEGTDYQLNTIAKNKLVGCTQLPWIGMKTAGNEFVPWLCSQTDGIANDWCVVD